MKNDFLGINGRSLIFSPMGVEYSIVFRYKSEKNSTVEFKLFIDGVEEKKCLPMGLDASTTMKEGQKVTMMVPAYLFQMGKEAKIRTEGRMNECIAFDNCTYHQGEIFPSF